MQCCLWCFATQDRAYLIRGILKRAIAELAGQFDGTTFGQNGLEFITAEHACYARQVIGRAAAVVSDFARRKQTNVEFEK